MLSTCELADSESMLDHVFRLGYSCNRRSGAIGDRPDERFRDRYDDLPNHFSFLMPKQAATVRISVVRPDGAWTECLPGAFSPIIPRLRHCGMAWFGNGPLRANLLVDGREFIAQLTEPWYSAISPCALASATGEANVSVTV